MIRNIMRNTSFLMCDFEFSFPSQFRHYVSKRDISYVLQLNRPTENCLLWAEKWFDVNQEQSISMPHAAKISIIVAFSCVKY